MSAHRVTEHERLWAELEAENNLQRFLVRSAAQRRRVLQDIARQLDAPQLNSQRDGTTRAHVGRSVPSGPSPVGVVRSLAALTLLGLLVVPVVGGGVAIALSRWGWDRIFGRRK